MLYSESASSFLSSHAVLIGSYLSSIDCSKFSSGLSCTEKLSSLVFSFKNSLTIKDSDDLFNDAFLMARFSDFMKEYVLLWEKIFEQDYENSWMHLQKCLGCLRVISKFANRPLYAFLAIFSKQLLSIEKLYPYKLFASEEIVYDGGECSICSKSITEDSCPHAPGQLYRGEFCRIVNQKIVSVEGFAFVENPVNKMNIASDLFKPAQFILLDNLNRDMSRFKKSPLCLKEVKYTLQKIDPSREKIPRNSTCPCGSGKKFKKCCWLKKEAVRDSFELLLTATKIAKIDDFLG